MLRTRNREEAEFWEAVRVEAANVWDTLMTNLARKVVEETAKARKRGQSSSGG